VQPEQAAVKVHGGRTQVVPFGQPNIAKVTHPGSGKAGSIQDPWSKADFLGTFVAFGFLLGHERLAAFTPIGAS